MRHKALAGVVTALLLGSVSTAVADPAWMENAQMPPLPGCAQLHWNIVRRGDNLNGIIWFADGTGFASVAGSVNPSDNSFRATFTPVSGSSPPSGSVTGRTVGDDVEAELHCGKCADLSVKFPRGASQATPM